MPETVARLSALTAVHIVDWWASGWLELSAMPAPSVGVCALGV